MTLPSRQDAAVASPAWQGQWLWLPNVQAQAQTTLLFRRSFELDEPVEEALLRISAAHIYRVYLNGQDLGRGPARSDPRFPYFDAYRVGTYLKTGANLLVCLVHHMQPLLVERGRPWNLYDGPGGLLAELDLGSSGCVATDDTWQVTQAPGWHDTAIAGHGFHPPIHEVDVPTFSAAMQAVVAGEDELLWQTPACRAVEDEGLPGIPIEAEVPQARSVRHESPRISSVANAAGQIHPHPQFHTMGAPEHSPVVAPSPEGGWLVFDLPHPMAGTYELAVRTEGTAILDVYCGEGAEQHLSDRLRVAGPCCFQPLDWRGGDRVAVHVRQASAPVALSRFTFIEWRYPYTPRGDFHCSDEPLNSLWRICQRTAWQSTHDHLVDCVWREQALWIEDMYVHARAIRAAFGDMRPVAKGLRQALRLMDKRGVVPVPGPSGCGYRNDGAELMWGTQALTLPLTAREHYWHTADEALARWCVERFASMLRFYAGHEDHRGLLRTDPPGKQALVPFGGWDPQLKSGTPTPLNSLYAMSLQATAELAERVGQHDLAAAWQQRADRTVDSLRALCWDAEHCVMLDGECEGELVRGVSRTSNAWAALAGVVPANRAGAWAEALRRDPEVMDTTSPYDATLWLMALAKFDLDLHVRELLSGYFASIVRHGHPTLPEYWLEHDPTMAGTQQDSSRCHPYGTGPAFVSHDYILGVQPLAPGYRELLIRPRALGLTQASGRVPTPAGDVVVQWRHSPTRWEVAVELPAGVVATVELPRQGWNRETLMVEGDPVWEAPRWAHVVELADRTYKPQEPRVVRHALDQPGRHTLSLETH